jgi:hypothetical protein
MQIFDDGLFKHHLVRTAKSTNITQTRLRLARVPGLYFWPQELAFSPPNSASFSIWVAGDVRREIKSTASKF